MKYAVLGAGAVGAALGAFFAKAGQETWFVDPFEAHMKAIEEKGLRIVSAKGEEIVNVRTATTSDPVGKADIVLFMVKGIHTEGAIEGLKKLVGESTIILTLQNGYGNVDILKKYFPAEQIAYGMTSISSSMVEPGAVRPVISDRDMGVSIGGESRDGAFVDKLKAVAEDFKKGGCLAEYSEDIDIKIWTKIVRNLCANALCALTRLNGRSLYAQQEAVDLMILMIRETCTVAQAKGIELLPSKVTPTFVALPEETSWVREVYPSMAQDVMHKRKTEIDFLQGAIAQEGKRLGIATPYCDCVHKLLKVIENTYDKQF